MLNWAMTGGDGFGVPHPGICNFLIGDGSVRSISVTVTDEVIVPLGDVSDGKVVPTL
jgi:hypothetical protein